MSAKEQMLKMSKNYGWPVMNEGDLDIDFREIDKHGESRRFGWALRKLGTHIFTSVDDAEMINRIFGPNIHWFFWDSYQLTEMGIAELVGILED